MSSLADWWQRPLACHAPRLLRPLAAAVAVAARLLHQGRQLVDLMVASAPRLHGRPRLVSAPASPGQHGADVVRREVACRLPVHVLVPDGIGQRRREAAQSSIRASAQSSDDGWIYYIADSEEGGGGQSSLSLTPSGKEGQTDTHRQTQTQTQTHTHKEGQTDRQKDLCVLLLPTSSEDHGRRPLRGRREQQPSPGTGRAGASAWAASRAPQAARCRGAHTGRR